MLKGPVARRGTAPFSSTGYKDMHVCPIQMSMAWGKCFLSTQQKFTESKDQISRNTGKLKSDMSVPEITVWDVIFAGSFVLRFAYAFKRFN